MSIQATAEQIASLVENLQRFPLVWDCQHPMYHNRIAREQQWSELGKTVGLEEKDLKWTYDTLRKKFRDISIGQRTLSFPDAVAD